MEDEKVFTSKVERVGESKDDLYDLLKISPAKPRESRQQEELPPCEFQPKYDKFYVPKRNKAPKHSKVKTVRDIRRQYEKDINVSLPEELDRQQNALLKKIRYRSTYDETTKNLAKKLLKSEDPVSRPAWEMLTNVNPEGHRHSTQYVLWKGRNIRINGSKGGKVKFLCKYDLAKNHQNKMNKYQNLKRPCLLKDSVVAKFKPGPLSKKKNLDISHQRYNVGGVKLLELPKPCFEIKPVLGLNLEPVMTKFVENLRDPNGKISKEWALYAVSMLGILHQGKPRQLNEQEPVVFDLKYKCNQQQIIMRCDEDINQNSIKVEPNIDSYAEITDHDSIEKDVENVLTGLINSIEISEMQDSLLLEDDAVDPQKTETTVVDKEKPKRKFKELDRLAITVIELPANLNQKPVIKCDKAYCSLGCVCLSLQNNYHIKKHCGRVECMFDCKCNFKLNDINNPMSCLPHLLNLDKEINAKLAKEEQKFHQTVVMSGEKSVLFKSHKRSCRASTKYDDFLTNLGVKHKPEINKALMLHMDVLKLNLNNVEPWCMVHKLYKCFCKGRFTECVSKVVDNVKDIKEKIDVTTKEKAENTFKNDKTANSFIIPADTIDMSPEKKEIDNPLLVDHLKSSKKGISLLKSAQNHDCLKCPDTVDNITDNKGLLRTYRRNVIESSINIAPKASDNVIEMVNKRLSTLCRSSVDSNTFASKYNIDTIGFESKKRSMYSRYNSESSSSSVFDSDSTAPDKCARTESYSGRNHRDAFYSRTNKKIKQFEDNDKIIKKRLITLMGLANLPDVQEDLNMENSLLKPLSSSSLDIDSSSSLVATNTHDANNQNSLIQMMVTRFGMLSKSKLIHWFEQSYKQYKQRQAAGIMKISLEPPRPNKLALHPWRFIVSRYRERKNIFLITNKKLPYRIFMAVDSRSPFFKDCININEIGFADLHKYPQTVQSLLTNSSDMKDQFCILCGLTECWEIIGTVTKVAKDTESEINEENQPTLDVDSSNSILEYPFDKVDEIQDKSAVENAASKPVKPNVETRVISWETSRWFLMVIEKDFSEIQFSEKGFFVKYESIIKAINVARFSGKTVRLSAAQKGADTSNGPLFGIYAIPNSKDHCVFVGPYEENEPLGIETIKILTHQRKIKSTRGIWITTKKIDNMKVIDNPMLFMPAEPNDEEMTPLTSDSNKSKKVKKIVKKCKSIPESTAIDKSESNICSNTSLNLGVQATTPADLENQIGMTMIRKMDDHQAILSGMETKTSTTTANPTVPGLCSPDKNETGLKSPEVKATDLKSPEAREKNLKSPEPIVSELKDNIIPGTSSDTPIESSEDETIEKKIIIKSQLKLLKPIKIKKSNGFFKLANQLIPLKIPAKDSVVIAGQNKYVKIKPLTTILKPQADEKVNVAKPVAEIAPFGKSIVTDGTKKNMMILKPEQINQRVVDLVSVQAKEEIEEDIERFLARTEQVECGDPNGVFVISDDEEEPVDKEPLYKDVFIECKNIDIGWIRGRQNKDGLISFEFPGFKFTEFYTHHDAFIKIYQVLSRKVYIPNSIFLQWDVVERLEDLTNKEMLSTDKLGPNYVVTKKGIRHTDELKADIMGPPRKKAMLSSGDAKPSTSDAAMAEEFLDTNTSDQPMEFDEEINTLEDASNTLWEKRVQILNTLSNVSMENKEEMFTSLKDMLNSANDT